MRLDDVHSVHFLGIGGIGMSALARWFHAQGYAVSGYDKTSTSLTDQLIAEGMNINFSDSISSIPGKAKNDKSETLIVYTPAIPSDSSQYQFFLNGEYQLYKRSQVLGMLTESKFTIAVAGTHGKTTTSSMIAHLLTFAGVDCSAFVGGIMTNYNTNLLIGKQDQVMVVEADEYDRSFLTLHPDVAIITATDADHLDIYGSKESLKDSFNQFIKKIKTNGHLLVEESVAGELDLNPSGDIHVQTYGLHKGDIHAQGLKIGAGTFDFEFNNMERVISGFELSLPGYHNVSNAVAAVAASQALLDDEQVVDGIKSYLGVKRRFEYIIKTDDLVYIDDYAHHPEELRVLMESVRALYPNKKITALFQPHLYTRTRDFADGFAKSLSMADEVLLLDIYPARELPIAGVSSDMLVDRIEDVPVFRFKKDDVLSHFDAHTPEVLLTIGAGNVDTLIVPIKNKLERR